VLFVGSPYQEGTFPQALSLWRTQEANSKRWRDIVAQAAAANGTAEPLSAAATGGGGGGGVEAVKAHRRQLKAVRGQKEELEVRVQTFLDRY